MDDVERDMTLELLVGRLEENEALARAALQMVAILVHKCGGEVEITMADMVAVQAFDLAQIEKPDEHAIVLRIERKRPH